jgi:primosomal protein N' (replication factor Y)
MGQKMILRLALPTPLRRLFDYLPPQDVDPTTLIPGVRVQVPFQRRTLVGILVEVTTNSSVSPDRLKTAQVVLDKVPIFSPDIYALCQFAADYYHYSLGEVFASALPVLLRKGKILDEDDSSAVSISSELTVSSIELNEAQRQAVDKITLSLNHFTPFLLNGVTGSGKTEVYFRVIEKVLQQNQQVLILVPEISLTPQTIERFHQRFQTSIVALHSHLSDKERLQGFIAARDNVAKIIIGTRSAIFTPFANLGLIIVDEEHDTSFKQQDRFRYQARDLAIMRANRNHIPIILGSATPSLESLLNVKRGRYQELRLMERAGQALLPTYTIVDMRCAQHEEGLSETLLNAMKVELEQNNQVMLFLNRRGFAPVLYCAECGHILECRRCDARLVYHRSINRLQCHHCDWKIAVPSQCSQCQSTELVPVGIGTQRLEEALSKYFPDIEIIRVDRDSTRKKNAMQLLMKKIHSHPKAILLGTQMLAKGHHFPNVTLVGIVDVDSGLLSANFRAAEQMGQLLVQVSGRAGRAEKKGRVFIQTMYPDHVLLQTLIHQGYQAFAENLLRERETALLPPYSHFAVLRAEAYQEKDIEAFLQRIKTQCATANNAITWLGPVDALLQKKKGLYCKHLILQSTTRGILATGLKQLLSHLESPLHKSPVKWILDVDPVEVM